MGDWHQCCQPRGDRDRLRAKPPRISGWAGMCTAGRAAWRREAGASGTETEGGEGLMSMSAAHRTALGVALVLAAAACSTTRQAQAPEPAAPSTAPGAPAPGRPG